MSVHRKIISVLALLVLSCAGLWLVRSVSAGPVISGINAPIVASSSVLINFQTDAPAWAYLEYGPTTGYGASTLRDSARYYKEHAIQITGLTANATYHYRVVATSASGTTTGSDQTVTVAAGNSPIPNLPSQVDSTMPDMTGAVNKTVKNSGGDYTPAQFQNALDDAGVANEKRFITVDAGVTVSGRFTIPENADGNYIIVRSANYASLPEGVRVSSVNAANMFKIQASTVDPALVAALRANHVRFIGAEITIDPSVLADAPGGASQSGIVQFQWLYDRNPVNLPRFIGFDRCWIHGQPTKNTRRGILWIGEDIFVIDSTVDEFHDTGFDAQAILSVDVNRSRILNSTLIGSGENFMWGGTGLATPGYVIGELEYIRNFQYYPISWKNNGPSYAGFQWVTKNLFECKTCSKVLLFGNYFGGVTPSQGGYWPYAQSLSLNFKLEQDSIGPTTCDLMQDITVYKNWGRNLAAGIAVVGRTNSAQGCTNNPARVKLLGNVWEYDAATWTPATGASSGSWGAGGGNWGNTQDLQIVHNSWVNANPTQSATCNSVFTDGSISILGEPTSNKWPGFVLKDNYIDFRACGIFASGFFLDAIGALDGQFTGYVVTNNGILRTAGPGGNFPPGQIFATDWTVQLVNFNSGLSGDYRVAPASTWHNAASDGTDVGADFNAVVRASENTPTGAWLPGPTPTPTPTPTPGAGTLINGKVVISGKVVIQ